MQAKYISSGDTVVVERSFEAPIGSLVMLAENNDKYSSVVGLVTSCESIAEDTYRMTLQTRGIIDVVTQTNLMSSPFGIVYAAFKYVEEVGHLYTVGEFSYTAIQDSYSIGRALYKTADGYAVMINA